MASGFIKLTIRHYWSMGGDPWLDSPLCWFYIGITLTLDAIYPTVIFHFCRTERVRDGKKAKGN